jgi:hypothetical protein
LPFKIDEFEFRVVDFTFSIQREWRGKKNPELAILHRKTKSVELPENLVSAPTD